MVLAEERICVVIGRAADFTRGRGFPEPIAAGKSIGCMSVSAHWAAPKGITAPALLLKDQKILVLMATRSKEDHN